MENLQTGSDTLFILLGAIMVLAMHAGFAFLELGTVRKKNQVNALVKIVTDFAVSTLAYFFIGYSIAYGVNFFTGAEQLAQKSGYELVKFFFLLTFAAAIPAIVSGGVAERAKFNPMLVAAFVLVGFIYPFFEGIAWDVRCMSAGWYSGWTTCAMPRCVQAAQAWLWGWGRAGRHCLAALPCSVSLAWHWARRRELTL